MAELQAAERCYRIGKFEKRDVWCAFTLYDWDDSLGTPESVPLVVLFMTIQLDNRGTEFCRCDRFQVFKQSGLPIDGLPFFQVCLPPILPVSRHSVVLG